MPGFFLSLIVCFALAVPGREGARVAQLAARLGPGTGLLVAIWLSAAATSALAGWAATQLDPMLAGAAKMMLVAFALALGAADLVFRPAPRAPVEPTRSAGAMLLVLLFGQATDGARFAVVALALATAAPVPAALGGALGTGAALTLAALAGAAWAERLPLRALGWGLAAALLLAAAVCALSARGLIG